MRLSWWRRNHGAAEQELAAWLAAWRRAVSERDEAQIQRLATETGQRRVAGVDVELEEEMVDGARRAIALEREIASTGLPTIPTSHRVVGTEGCHFTAPVSLIDDPAQPSGRLLLTGSRAIFVGGPQLIQIAWHSIREARDDHHDVLLIRTADAWRYRCNTYGDALAGSIVARHLVERARRI